MRSDVSDQITNVPPANVGITPFAFQHYAKDFYEAYKKHKGGPQFSPASFFLITRSIELAAKSLHLADGRTAKDLTSGLLLEPGEKGLVNDYLQALGALAKSLESDENIAVRQEVRDTLYST